MNEVVPFIEGVLADAASPDELIDKARRFPRESMSLFEKGLVQAWYDVNGWDYPVKGSNSTGLGAMDKFFAALAAPPPRRAAEPRPAPPPARPNPPPRVQPAASKLSPSAPVAKVPAPSVPAAGVPAAKVAAPSAPAPNVLPAKVQPPAVPAPGVPTPSVPTPSVRAKRGDIGAGLIAPALRASIVAGWAALLGWLPAEACFGRVMDAGESGPWPYYLMVLAVAGVIGSGLTLANFANVHWKSSLIGFGLGLAGGCVGGLVGAFIGGRVYTALESSNEVLAALGRTGGWICMGIAIGAADGLRGRSWLKVRNGLIGGAVGGLLGGLLFDPLLKWIGSPMTSRACAFVLLGLFIGLFIGLVQQLLKEGWLTVVQGFRPGRQMILQEVATLGTSEKAHLSFIAFGAKGVEPTHTIIRRERKGLFFVVDNKSRTGTFVNDRPITDPVVLRDGDLIRFGPNIVRYNARAAAG